MRKAEHTPADEADRARSKNIGLRQLWGQDETGGPDGKTAEVEPEALYEGVEAILPLGLPFVRTAVSDGLVRLAFAA